MAESTKKSVMAIVAEVTENTPVTPTSGSQYIALQEGFELEPAFDTLENAELTSSVGKAAPILGIENPTASLSHYIRNSHVEASEPNFGLLIEGAIGDKSPATAEILTDPGSTAGTSTAAAIIEVTSGATFERGEALLIKDPAGYQIRPVHSVNVDQLTLGFNLPTATPSGVGTGRATLYKPSDTPPSMTIHDYRANGGAHQVISGAKVSELTIDAKAGDFLNGSFSFEGAAFYYNPVEITATDTKLDFLDNVTTRVATVAAKYYKDPHDLASALATSMNSLGSGNTFTVTYSDSNGKYTIASNGTTLSLLWNTGANTANTIGDKIGFLTAADDTGALTYTSDNAISISAPQSVAFDAGQPLVVKNMEVMIGDFDDYGCSSAQEFSLKITNEQQSILDICEESGVSAKILKSRTVECDVKLTLTAYDSDKFRRFRSGSDVRFGFNFGVKDGGNWVPGKCGNIYMPQAKISSFKVADADGIVTIEATISAYVDSSGLGEIYLSFV